MKKIAIVGPESSGKSTLAQELMLRARAWYVSEVAREYIDNLERPYGEADLLEIAHAQARNEEMVSSEFKGLMVCDTDLITIRIWSEEKFGRCHPWILEQSEKRHYDHWLLCMPDIPWEPDPQRAIAKPMRPRCGRRTLAWCGYFLRDFMSDLNLGLSRTVVK